MKIGKFIFTFPDDAEKKLKRPEEIYHSVSPSPSIKTEGEPYIYKTTDPFQSSLDEVQMMSKLSHTKLWVRVTWFILYIMLTPLIGLVGTYSFYLQGERDVMFYIFLWGMMMLFMLPFIILWRRKKI